MSISTQIHVKISKKYFWLKKEIICLSRPITLIHLFLISFQKKSKKSHVHVTRNKRLGLGLGFLGLGLGLGFLGLGF